jgi:hypothetical protein
MANANYVQRPHFDGWHSSDIFTQGTGGHGDTIEAYTQTFSKVLSMVTMSDRYNTGKRDDDGKIIYYTRSYKENRASHIKDVYVLSPLIVREFLSVGFCVSDKVSCFDLMKWQINKDNIDVEVKKGISLVVGSYEARIIKGKHVFLYKNKIVRKFKGCAK